MSAAALPDPSAASSAASTVSSLSVPPDVVLLGASNISFSLPTIVRAVQRTFDSRVRLWTVHGHGRSYGRRSRTVGRELDGIIESQFWADFAARPPLGPGGTHGALFGLLTDLGNDLIYSVEPPQILDWARECGRRLTELGSADRPAELTVTRLPAAALLRLSAPRYHATRKLFFPKFNRSWPEMKIEIARLDEQVPDLAAELSAAIVPTDRRWYFIDPIHVRERRRREAWSRYLGAWPSAPSPDVPLVGPRDRFRMHTLPQAIKWVGGEPVTAANPVYVDGDFQLHQY